MLASDVVIGAVVAGPDGSYGRVVSVWGIPECTPGGFVDSFYRKAGFPMVLVRITRGELAGEYAFWSLGECGA